MEFTLLWAALTGGAGLWAGVRLVRSQPGFARLDRPLDTLIGAAVIGLATGRLAAMVGAGTSPIAHPVDILLVRGGVHTGVASLAALLGIAWLTRRCAPEALDLLAPAALLGLAGWQAGCLWRGACLGTASNLPWTWAQPGSDITRHPVELYAATILGVGAIAVLRLVRIRPGLAASTGLGVASLARLATEPFRPSISGGPVWWYTAGIVIALIGLAASVWIRRAARG